MAESRSSPITKMPKYKDSINDTFLSDKRFLQRYNNKFNLNPRYKSFDIQQRDDFIKNNIIYSDDHNVERNIPYSTPIIGTKAGEDGIIEYSTDLRYSNHSLSREGGGGLVIADRPITNPVRYFKEHHMINYVNPVTQ
jgi:hypothetical protein